MKAIFAEDIRAGDVILPFKQAQSVIVKSVDKYVDDRRVMVHRGDCVVKCFFNLPVGSIVGLLHRSWPEGKTEGDMWGEVTALASELYDQILPSLRAIDLALRLREAIEAYELGKPLEPVKESEDH